MTWDDAVPNLLIGLREGLEAGLVVSILLAALRRIELPEGFTSSRADGRPSSAPIWLGVLGAIMVSGSFAAVLTFSTDVLSSSAQEAVGGLLSVFAVALVTAMIFWMRRTAAMLSGELRGKVAHAVSLGPGALALTAFLAVGREGLETTLFLWTAVRASGQTVVPLFGAGLGLLAAVVICALLYRQAIRLDLGTFFGRTALALIVIAAGVLSYGLGDLQDAGLLAGQRWIAFDLSARVDSSSWWVTLISGVSDLSTRMTVLQVVAWLAYLGVVLPLFVHAGRQPLRRPTAQSTTQPTVGPAADAGRIEQLARRRPRVVAGVLVVVPVAAAAVTIALLPAAAVGAATTVSVTAADCAPGWSSAHAGQQTFDIRNESGRAGEINLDDAAGAVVAEIETIGPATTAELEATLGNGAYSFRCIMAGQPTTTSATVQVTGAGAGAGRATTAVRPVTRAELQPADTAYRHYAASRLRSLASDVGTLRAELRRGDLAGARRDWLPAQLMWERVGASYDSFGASGVAVDGLPAGLRGGVGSPQFIGLHRLEYGLWHGQRAAELRPVAARLAHDVATVRRTLSSQAEAGDPTNLPIRAHEILEDAQRDHLAGLDDNGAGAAYPETYADVRVTRVVLAELSPLLRQRAPRIVPELDRQLTTLQSALLATRSGAHWRSLTRTPLLARQHVDAAIGAALQTLDRVPDLLEVPPTH